ncbi:MAG: NOB1 family endonuclease [Pyrodictiaceae archaeon]
MVSLEDYCRSSGDRRIIVADTTAFLAALQLQAYSYLLVTTPDVIDEVRDSDSRDRLELALEVGRVKIGRPSNKHLHKVLSKAVDIGEHGVLSRTDIGVAALALELKEAGCEVIVVTDDYALQNLLSHLGIVYKPLRTRGITRRYKYIYVCPACGYVSYKPGERICPRCGTTLVKRRLKQ